MSTSPAGTNRPPRRRPARGRAAPAADAAERRSASGIVIPATASVGRRLVWSAVVAVGQHVRQVQVGDRVLHDPEDLAEVDLQGEGYLLLRERDIHAVAAERVEDGGTGLYL